MLTKDNCMAIRNNHLARYLVEHMLIQLTDISSSIKINVFDTDYIHNIHHNLSPFFYNKVLRSKYSNDLEP